MSKARGSPRKFSEKIALLNKKEAEATAEFEKILKEVEATTRTPAAASSPSRHNQYLQSPYNPNQNNQPQTRQYNGLPTRSSSFSSYDRTIPRQNASIHHPHHQQNQDQRLAQQQSHGQYLAQPVLFDSNHMQQQQQQPAGSVYSNHQSQSHHQPQSTYINHQHAQQQPQQSLLHSTHQTQQQQQQQQLGSLQVALNHDGLSQQPLSLGVPNIEIFPIDDGHNYQQVTSASNTLMDGHFRQDCSNSSISSSRSLPNIANLSVSQPIAGFTPQTTCDQRLLPTVTTTTVTGTTKTSSSHQLSPDVHVTSNTLSGDPYTTNDYFNNEEYCSLPPIHGPTSVIDDGDANQQSQTGLTRNSSWQSMNANSAPCSAAPTPPSGIVQSSNEYDLNQPHHSPQQTGQQQQQQQTSPNLLHQDYYTTQQQSQQHSSQAQMVRASSANIINKYQGADLLEAPHINNNLSKSLEPYYGYLDGYIPGSAYSNGQTGMVDESYGQTSLTMVNDATNAVARSLSVNDANTMSTQDNFKQTNQLTETNQQQFIDASPYGFYN